MKTENGELEYIAQNNISTIQPDVLDYESKSVSKLEYILKRMIDIIGSIFGIIALIPLSVCIYIANLIAKDKGPLFYSQKRIGKDGKIFKMYKYRSMVVGADEKLEEYLNENEDARKEYKEYKKLKHDPRVTKVGEFIRRTSLDEFPQFINVLKGEMTLVGPRPYLEREIEDMGEFYKYIISLKPGVTGLWQISGRSDVTFKDRIDLDMDYYNDNNLLTDIRILWKTALKLVKKEGAI